MVWNLIYVVGMCVTGVRVVCVHTHLSAIPHMCVDIRHT